MKTLATTLIFAALLGQAWGQISSSTLADAEFDAMVDHMRMLARNVEDNSTLSVSGQFRIFTPLAFNRKWPREVAENTSLVFLEAKMLAVSCERIKESLYRQLAAPGAFRGKVQINLLPARSAHDPIALQAEYFPGTGWKYILRLPDALERTRFVRTIVDVLLLEMANRNAGSRSAEIPAWLAEGLTEQLLATDGASFVLPLPNRVENGVPLNRMVWQEWRTNAVARAERVLRTIPPLNFEQLSWPEEQQLIGEAGEAFRSSAHLFVNRLLQLPNGPASLCAMIGQLPRHYNWQFAFLSGFQNYFQRLLDVEKWWALQLVQFTGRDLMQAWTLEESWRKLDEVVRSVVEIRTRPEDLPMRTEVSLQRIIREWDTAHQSQVFPGKLKQLELLRPRVAEPLILLVDDYRRLLEYYFQKRSTSGTLLRFNRAAGPIQDRLAEETILQLDILDARRAALKPGGAPSITAVEPGAPAAR